MSHVREVTLEDILDLVASTGEGKMAAKAILQKKNMLEAIEECRFEAGLEYNRTMHTILDVLQYIVERN